jgi:hypothetical protein
MCDFTYVGRSQELPEANRNGSSHSSISRTFIDIPIEWEAIAESIAVAVVRQKADAWSLIQPKLAAAPPHQSLTGALARSSHCFYSFRTIFRSPDSTYFNDVHNNVLERMNKRGSYESRDQICNPTLYHRALY